MEPGRETGGHMRRVMRKRDDVSRTAGCNVLGVPVEIRSTTELVATVAQSIEDRRPTVFVGLYASLFRAVERNPEYLATLATTVNYPDGMGVCWALNRSGFHAERVSTTDAVHPLAAAASKEGWRVGLYGGRPGVAERAAAALRASAPGLDVVLVHDGYSDAVLSAFEGARLDMLFVGLGAVRQEEWALRVGCETLGIPAVLTCGGLFDFLAGDRRRAPHLVQAAGLEWLFRTVLEPLRLGPRYALGNSHFIWRVLQSRRRSG